MLKTKPRQGRGFAALMLFMKNVRTPHTHKPSIAYL